MGPSSSVLRCYPCPKGVVFLWHTPELRGELRAWAGGRMGGCAPVCVCVGVCVPVCAGWEGKS